MPLPVPTRALVRRATVRASLLCAAAAVAFVPAARAGIASVCPPVAAGHARCDAQVIVRGHRDLMGSGRALVHPHVRIRPPLRHTPRLWMRTAMATGAPSAAEPAAGTPAYLQQAYDLGYLSQTRGAGDTVAVVDADNDPGAATDLATFRSSYGLPPCTAASNCFRQVNQSGAPAPLPVTTSAWQTEESIDLDAVSSLCPNCQIVLVEADGDDLPDLEQAVATADALGANQISISWSEGMSAPPTAPFTFPGVATVASTGDAGYTGAGNDSYPAALTGVTAAGGTTLEPSSPRALSARGFAETAWSLSGGEGGGSGCDVAEPKPAFQTDTGCTGRAYADVSADANPATGLVIYDSAQGGWVQAGGTSLAAPLIAAYYAVTGVSATTPAWAYADAALLNDPTSGSTGTCAAAIAYICTAGPGYDGPTGIGSISGDVTAGAPGIGGPAYGAGARSSAANTYASGVTATGASLVGGVYANGAATTVSWQYGTTTAYGAQTPATAIGAGAGATPVSASLAGLAPGTTYHYRLVAQNGYGTTYGFDSTLTTAGSPVTTGAAAAATGSGATVAHAAAASHRASPKARRRTRRRNTARARTTSGRRGRRRAQLVARKRLTTA